MSEWRELLAGKKWDDLDNWWRHCPDLNEVGAFYRALHAAVPKKELRNGMERALVPVSTKEAPEEWKGGAQILELGELECHALGGIPRPAEQLRLEIVRLTALLQDLMAKPALTTGDDAFSRARHVEVVFDQFEELRKITACATFAGRPRINACLEDIIAEAFLCGLEAGSHAWAAVGKDFEHLAAKKEQDLKHNSAGGLRRAQNTKARDFDIVQKMKEIIARRGISVRAAAQVVSKMGSGPSAEAIRKIYSSANRPTKENG